MKLRVYNSTLEPNIWNKDKTLKPEIKDHLLKIAEDFYNSTDLKSDIQNVLLLGSCVNFNWTPYSDLGLHVIIDVAGEKINDEYARKFMDGLSFKWNTEHHIEVKGHPVEVYLQDIREPNSTAQQARPGAAIYSLFDDKWMLEPNPQNVKLDADKIRKKFQSLRKSIDELIKTQDVEKMKTLMKSIRNYRDAGLAEGGEFSVENLVFKALRHVGDLRKLKDTIMTIYDRKTSLPEEGNVRPYKKTKPLNESGSTRYYEITGMVNSNLKVESEKYYGNQPWVNHVVIVNRHGFDWNDSLKWRYDSANQVVAFEDGMTAEQKIAIKEHLKTRYGVVGNIRFAMYAKKNENQLREVDDKFLVIGFINGALEIIADVDTKGGLDHEMVLKNHPEFDKGEIDDLSFWRYKSLTNMLTWLLKNPTGQQRHSVVEYLREKFSTADPRQELGQYGNDAYKIDENTNKLVRWILTKNG